MVFLCISRISLTKFKFPSLLCNSFLASLPETILLYFRNRQFAVVENPGFWNWTFSLVDEDDKLLAQIDRNWRGIGFEVISFSVHTY